MYINDLVSMVTNFKNGEKIVIRCSRETKKMFYRFVLECGFKNGEEALLFLLRKSEELKLRPEKGAILV